MELELSRLWSGNSKLLWWISALIRGIFFKDTLKALWECKMTTWAKTSLWCLNIAYNSAITPDHYPLQLLINIHIRHWSWYIIKHDCTEQLLFLLNMEKYWREYVSLEHTMCALVSKYSICIGCVGTWSNLCCWILNADSPALPREETCQEF